MERLARWVALALLPAWLVPSTGCTVIGVAVGGSIPRCPPPQTGPVDLTAVPIGTDVEVDYVANDPSGSNPHTAKVEGVYRGTDWTRAYIESNELSYSIPLSRVRDTRTREGARSYALEGLLVGMGLDVAFLGFLLLSNFAAKPGYD
jgi:hypothetical protein